MIQSWYDWSWFAFLLGWIYLAIEMIATAIVELMDKREQPMIPRWFTWVTLAGAASLAAAGASALAVSAAGALLPSAGASAANTSSVVAAAALLIVGVQCRPRVSRTAG